MRPTTDVVAWMFPECLPPAERSDYRRVQAALLAEGLAPAPAVLVGGAGTILLVVLEADVGRRVIDAWRPLAPRLGWELYDWDGEA